MHTSFTGFRCSTIFIRRDRPPRGRPNVGHPVGVNRDRELAAPRCAAPPGPPPRAARRAPGPPRRALASRSPTGPRRALRRVAALSPSTRGDADRARATARGARRARAGALGAPRAPAPARPAPLGARPRPSRPSPPAPAARRPASRRHLALVRPLHPLPRATLPSARFLRASPASPRFRSRSPLSLPPPADRSGVRDRSGATAQGGSASGATPRRPPRLCRRYRTRPASRRRT